MATTIQKDGRQWHVDSTGINSLTRRYTITLDTNNLPSNGETPLVGYNLPIIGSSHPSYSNLKVQSYDVEEGEDNEKKILNVTVNYAFDDSSETTGTEGYEYRIEHWGWDLGTSDQELTTDISGNGVKFYKPNLAPDFSDTNLTASSIVAVKNDNATSKFYYHQFELTFTQSNASVKTGVYLSHESTITEKSGGTTEIENAVRVAFLDTSNNLLLYWAPHEITTGNSKTMPNTYLMAASEDPVNMFTFNFKVDNNFFKSKF